MKKFYAFAAAAAIAMSANAQALYMTGASTADADNGGLPAEWAPSNPAEFEIVNGNFELTVNGLTSFKISTTKSDVEGDWTGFNEGILTCNYGEEQGVTVDLEPGTGDSPNILCPWEGDWKVVVAGDFSTITMTTDTPKPAGGIQLYFRGDMNGWGSDDAWLFENVGENTFRFVCAEGQQINAGEGFKIADANWAKYNFGAGEDPILADMDNALFNNGGNITLDEAWTGTCYLTIDPEVCAEYAAGAVAVMYFATDAEDVPEWFEGSGVANVAIDENAPAQYYTLQGVRVANPEKGLYIVVKGEKSYKAVVK